MDGNTYIFKAGAVKIKIHAPDIDTAYKFLDEKIEKLYNEGVELPSSMTFELYTNY